MAPNIEAAASTIELKDAAVRFASRKGNADMAMGVAIQFRNIGYRCFESYEA